MFDYVGPEDSFDKRHLFCVRVFETMNRTDFDRIVGDAHRWCVAEFGRRDGKRWAQFDDAFWFTDPVDACAFRLRWC